MHNDRSHSSRWLPTMITGLHLALLGSLWAGIIGGLSSSLVTILIPTITVVKLAIAGVFGPHVNALSRYNLPHLLTTRRHMGLMVVIFLCYIILMALTAINGVEWNGVASKVCAGIIIGGDLYLIVRDLSRGATTSRTKPAPALDTEA